MENKNMKLLLILMFFALVSCHEDKIVFFRVQNSSSHDFIKIRKIDISGEKVFIADGRYNQVVVLDSNLNYVKKFGRHGQGPGELAQLYNISADDSGVYLMGTPAKIQSWSLDGIYRTEYFLKNNVSQMTRFAVDGSGTFYFSTPSKNTAILKWEGDSAYFIGQNMYTGRHDFLKNYNHILYDDRLGIIIQVGFINANFTCYNKAGEVLYTEDLNRFPPLKPVLESWRLKNLKNKQGSMAILFFDACLLNGDLYLLYHENEAPKIIRFKVNRKSLAYVETIHMAMNEKVWVEMFTMRDENTMLMANSLNEKIYLLTRLLDKRGENR